MQKIRKSKWWEVRELCLTDRRTDRRCWFHKDSRRVLKKDTSVQQLVRQIQRGVTYWWVSSPTFSPHTTNSYQRRLQQRKTDPRSNKVHHVCIWFVTFYRHQLSNPQPSFTLIVYAGRNSTRLTHWIVWWVCERSTQQHREQATTKHLYRRWKWVTSTTNTKTEQEHIHCFCQHRRQCAPWQLSSWLLKAGFPTVGGWGDPP